MEFIDLVILLTVYLGTGVYAVRMFRSSPRISTFVYVWLATGGFFVSGSVYRILSGHKPYYTDGLGGTHYLTSGDYGKAVLAAAIGLACIAIGHVWGRNRNWIPYIPNILDGRVPDNAGLYRWSVLFLLAGLIPIAATGVLNPITLFASLIHGRAAKGPATYIYSQGTFYSFAEVFGRLVPFGTVGTAILVWRGRRAVLPLTLCLFFTLVTLTSGTRSATAFAILPFIVLPRYMGQGARFAKLAIAGGLVLLVLFEVQLAYRSRGFSNINIPGALVKSSPVNALGGKELDGTGQAFATYGSRFKFLEGQSYFAVAVNPIPRVFWRGKPGGYSDVNALNLGFPFGTTMTSGWMGEAYANFGWIGIPLIGLIAGALMGWLDVMLAGSGAFAVAILLPLQFQWAFWVRGDSVAALDPWLFGFALAATLLLLIHPARIGAGNEAASIPS